MRREGGEAGLLVSTSGGEKIGRERGRESCVCVCVCVFDSAVKPVPVCMLCLPSCTVAKLVRGLATGAINSCNRRSTDASSLLLARLLLLEAACSLPAL